MGDESVIKVLYERTTRDHAINEPVVVSHSHEPRPRRSLPLRAPIAIKTANTNIERVPKAQFNHRMSACRSNPEPPCFMLEKVG